MSPTPTQTDTAPAVQTPFFVTQIFVSDRPPPGMSAPVLLTPAKHITHHHTLDEAIAEAGRRIREANYQHIFVYELPDGMARPLLRWPLEHRECTELQTKLLTKHSIAGTKLGFMDWMQAEHPEEAKRLADHNAELGPLKVMPLAQLIPTLHPENN